ncbi:MAG: hypothetical protein L0Y64_11960 [Myxococcaceae bacterium]|nr:hypothetical protein [Myxococcaceae bacterium]
MSRVYPVSSLLSPVAQPPHPVPLPEGEGPVGSARRKWALQAVTALTLHLAACGPELDVALQSQRGGTSHEAGNNCMACHQEEGLGKGRFTVAGTAYTPGREPNANATITLTAGGVQVLTLETDASGNFYTTAPVPMPEESVVPKVTNLTTADSISMPFPVGSGACNMCHTGRLKLVLD